jgi:hypothetical protein
VSSAFEDAVFGTNCLAAVYRSGLQAVRTSDRQRITCRDGRLLTGSIDTDRALLASYPDESRWDYGIGVKNDREHVVWVEIHPASSSHVQEVIDKLKWLHSWLRAEAPLLGQLTPFFVWVASGRVALTPNSPQRRRVAQAGIHFSGERLEVDTL